MQIKVIIKTTEDLNSLDSYLKTTKYDFTGLKKIIKHALQIKESRYVILKDDCKISYCFVDVCNKCNYPCKKYQILEVNSLIRLMKLKRILNDTNTL